jgi:hypothetical protein
MGDSSASASLGGAATCRHRLDHQIDQSITRSPIHQITRSPDQEI